ncbi:MAG: hypothetical protein IPL59_13215 [Candidatus Competibacteraceae bacterium]|uniref:Transmembrane protein n=1 Tax=Candidatus Contendobacter odensis Run_B_J11 TaxID=1400861 RepID=A0A7U7G8F6_9GAMM|nr:hypothetical protein [Candidatus Contendobacter odensis]MBK8535992.1 hypothetical protein [Candidatus Competibacteraceae bacterium]MBK8750453.1 hypothetical protein [Candidatus Competibacteraceae bacterium]CDH43450.1 conserved membrane hypothetical protein [Candidatus Contendobacter odensis Run_B_J11]
MIASIPLLVFVVAAYTALALVVPIWLDSVLFVLPLLSGAVLPFRGGDLLLVMGLLLLCVEIYRATSSSSAAILNHVLSLVVFIIALIELLVTPKMASMTFFLIMLMTLIDVITGFTVTISSARRDLQHSS